MQPVTTVKVSVLSSQKQVLYPSAMPHLLHFLFPSLPHPPPHKQLIITILGLSKMFLSVCFHTNKNMVSVTGFIHRDHE